MSRAKTWYRWRRRESTELFVLWGAAAVTYGVGDILTTLVLVYAVPGLDEANPFVHWGLDTFGVPGLVVLKLAVFGIGIYVSWLGIQHRDRLMYYLPPIVMSCVGLGATVFNIRLIF